MLKMDFAIPDCNLDVEKENQLLTTTQRKDGKI